ncbi:lytic transglycosylase domain-containing protein [Conexibacter woesei]|uniref:lytic transglycosylase domain-containing protein n=1 Tax=Conexibacter woesei TaxID=191495 RepID=UPI0003FA6FE1|nr:lytic transglycosylase domain-containing protein [Conexibacter woesei]
MSIELIGQRVAAIQQEIAQFTGQSSATSSTDFASQLAAAQSASGSTSSTTSSVASTATPTTLGGGTPTQYDSQITAAANKYGIDPALLKGLIRQESNFNASAQSGAGAQGLTQLMPATARSLGVDPSDPAQAIDGGAKYLKQQLDRFGGDASKALAAYNAGPGAVAKYGGVPPYAETQNYVKSVLAFADQYRASGTAAATASTTGTSATTAAQLLQQTQPVSAASLLASSDDSDSDSDATSALTAADPTTSSSGTLNYSTV